MVFNAPSLTMEFGEYVKDPIAKKVYRCHYCGHMTLSQILCYANPIQLANFDCSLLHQEEFE
jgi:hypothetical protein